MSTAHVVGVYPVLDAEEPCHLVEVAITDGTGLFEIENITQELETLPRSDWQVPFAERIVSWDGAKVLTEEFEAEEQPALWRGNFRLVFFFHFLDFDKPLATPFGRLRLPAATDVPSRLASIPYAAP